MSDAKMYPPGANVPSDPPPAYPHAQQPAYPTQAGSSPYPVQPGVVPSAPGSAVTAAQTMPGSNLDQKYSAANVKHMRWVPVFNMCLAVFFFVWNCIIPGLGMWFALPFLCCAHTVVKTDSMIKPACIAFGLGFISLLTLAFGLGYWIAIMWSVATIAASQMYKDGPIEEHEIQQKNPATGMFM